MNLSELSGPALDWAVAKCEGAMYCLEISPTRNSWESMSGFNARYSEWKGDGFGMDRPAYSTDWAQGGPIIGREGIDLIYERNSDEEIVQIWAQIGDATPPEYFGQTGLQAAMRCYVASKLGNKVEVPDELK